MKVYMTAIIKPTRRFSDGSCIDHYKIFQYHENAEFTMIKVPNLVQQLGNGFDKSS